uniref:Cytochrome c oxidase subunit 2 n=2 Tax=Epimyrma TaxID=105190 RepID=Q85UC4_9HYME|nr:cytochrome oxidase subunit II [Epimyrma adlerzi]AAO26670.1 cytochrome oxidase subunit II [Epimyrma ravouxi]
MNTWLLSLQNSNSPIYDMMIFFHDFTMIILIFITMLITLMMMLMTYNNLLIDSFSMATQLN